MYVYIRPYHYDTIDYLVLKKFKAHEDVQTVVELANTKKAINSFIYKTFEYTMTLRNIQRYKYLLQVQLEHLDMLLEIIRS